MTRFTERSIRYLRDVDVVAFHRRHSTVFRRTNVCACSSARTWFDEESIFCAEKSPIFCVSHRATWLTRKRTNLKSCLPSHWCHRGNGTIIDASHQILTCFLQCTWQVYAYHLIVWVVWSYVFDEISRATSDQVVWDDGTRFSNSSRSTVRSVKW